MCSNCFLIDLLDKEYMLLLQEPLTDAVMRYSNFNLFVCKLVLLESYLLEQNNPLTTFDHVFLHSINNFEHGTIVQAIVQLTSSFIRV